jgi:GNAT superfamily N-acetyltransferase
MKIIDLSPEFEKTYCMCLEEWSEEMVEAGDHKSLWYQKKKNNGLRVKLAQNDNDDIVGMIHYIPAEFGHITGDGLYFILCIWVHGYKEGVGNHQKKGIGTALLQAAEDDVRSLGAKGIAAWGITLPFFLRAAWFKKHGYQKADKSDIALLLWKQFDPEAKPPKWIAQNKKPTPAPGVVTISAFKHGWCPAQNLTFERAKRAADEFNSSVVFTEYNTDDDDVFQEWGISDALYIDGKKVNTGPSPKYDKIRKQIAQRVKRL